jgi:hypothetical protein
MQPAAIHLKHDRQTHTGDSINTIISRYQPVMSLQHGWRLCRVRDRGNGTFSLELWMFTRVCRSNMNTPRRVCEVVSVLSEKFSKQRPNKGFTSRESHRFSPCLGPLFATSRTASGIASTTKYLIPRTTRSIPYPTVAVTDFMHHHHHSFYPEVDSCPIPPILTDANTDRLPTRPKPTTPGQDYGR